jgi:hypothetical protein
MFDLGANEIERQPIESPQRNRRQITMDEAHKIKLLIQNLRYDQGWDDSQFFTLAQAAQVEGKKIMKQKPPNPTSTEEYRDGW